MSDECLCPVCEMPLGSNRCPVCVMENDRRAAHAKLSTIAGIVGAAELPAGESVMREILRIIEALP